MEARNNGENCKQTFGSDCQYMYSRQDDFVARGAYGCIYKAEISVRGNFNGQDDIAVKDVSLYDPKLWVNPQSFTELRNRWKTLLGLQHAHLVKYHKVSFTKGSEMLSAEFLMDYYKDGDLARLLKALCIEKILLDRITALSYATQIADGIAHLHENHIIHGDLKPSNVLVKRAENGQVVLLVADLDDLMHMRCSGTSVRDVTKARGTLRYMSPEMVRSMLYQMGDQHVGRKTDVWSLGCISLQLLLASIETFKADKNRLCSINNAAHIIDVADVFVHEKVRDGFVPYVPDQVPKSLAADITNCFRTPPRIRPSALELRNILQNEAEKPANAAMEASAQAQRLLSEQRTRNGTANMRNEVSYPTQSQFLITLEQFRNAVTEVYFFSQAPTDEQCRTLVTCATTKGKIETKRELAMFVANLLHESNGLQATEEYGPPYHPAESNPARPNLSYHGRGYMMLRGFPVYRAVSYGLYGDERLADYPDLVTMDAIAWDTAFWFWANKIHGRPEIAEGRFGVSGNLISGGQNLHPEKRFDIYERILPVFEIDEIAIP